MTRECQVRICERLGVRLPGPTRRELAAEERRAVDGAADVAGRWLDADREHAVVVGEHVRVAARGGAVEWVDLP